MELSVKRFNAHTSMKADKAGSIVVEFASFNQVDHDGDVTLPGAFGTQEARIQPIGHDTYAWSIGKGTIREAGDKAVFEGLLNLEMSEGKEAHASLKFDLEHGSPLQEWSYIYEPVRYDYGEHEGKQVRFLRQLKVYSVDPVFLGAGIGTRTTGVKFAGSFVEDLEDLDQRVSNALARIKERSDIRGKEGRTFSAANVTRLTAIADSLAGASSELKQLLIEADPKQGEEALLKAKLKFQQIVLEFPALGR